MKIQESIWDSNSHNGSSLVSVRVHSLTLFALSLACDVILKPPSWLATLQPLALVMSPRLKLQHDITRFKQTLNKIIWTYEWSKINWMKRQRNITNEYYFGKFLSTPDWWLIIKCIFKGWSITLTSNGYCQYGTRYINLAFGVLMIYEEISTNANGNQIILNVYPMMKGEKKKVDKPTTNARKSRKKKC